MELIALQTDMDIKRGYSENSLWIFANSMFVESIPICPVKQERSSPSLVAPIAVSNSLKNEAHQNRMSKSAD